MAEKYIVCSGKGGSGKSTVTVGLAAALASAGKRVLCADADTSVRSLDLLLETGEDILFNWYDAARGNCKKKDAVYDTLYKGVSLLPAPKSTEELTYDEFYELILSFESSYDYILFDAENCGTAFDFAAKICDKAIIVTTPDAVSLRSALQEIKRVLKDDGVLIAPTFTHAGNSFSGKVRAFFMKLAGFPLHSRWTSEEYLRFLRQNGWAVRKSAVLKASFPLTYAECVKSEV